MAPTDRPMRPLADAAVYDSTGDEIAHILDVVCDSSTGRVLFAVIALPGETDLRLVPWDAFQSDEQRVVLIGSKERLRSAAAFGRTDWRHPDAQLSLDTYPRRAYPPEDVAPTEVTHRRHSGARFVAVAVVLALIGGIAYIASRQGWSATAGQMYTLAAAVKDTTHVVRETSANAATVAKVKAALALSKRISALDIGVESDEGVATLTGKVPSQEVKELAGQITADTSGVRNVRNLLAVDPQMRPEQDRRGLQRRVEELERQAAIAEAIQQDAGMDGAKVRVRVSDDGVALEGTVAVENQKSRAEQIARSFPGVERVNNRLR
jgi:hyperosmotically inducible periplasmic protein